MNRSRCGSVIATIRSLARKCPSFDASGVSPATAWLCNSPTPCRSSCHFGWWILWLAGCLPMPCNLAFLWTPFVSCGLCGMLNSCLWMGQRLTLGNPTSQEATMRQPTTRAAQQPAFDFAASERNQQLTPECRQECRTLLVQLLKVVVKAESQERSSHERQDQRPAS
jgi:hypothetical protein